MGPTFEAGWIAWLAFPGLRREVLGTENVLNDLCTQKRFLRAGDGCGYTDFFVVSSKRANFLLKEEKLPTCP